MTATQVFFRFAKENGCYDIMRKCVLEAYINLKHLRKLEKYDSLVKMHGYKSFAVDILLKRILKEKIDEIYNEENTFDKLEKLWESLKL